jgi:ribosomal protein S18 acetylase RimI-like enzyme
MAIFPEYRGAGIGRMLMRDRVDFALNKGFSKVTLLVDKDKPHLQKYYESEGFAFIGEMFVFGSWYNKLEKGQKKR